MTDPIIQLHVVYLEVKLQMYDVADMHARGVRWSERIRHDLKNLGPRNPHVKCQH